jgi:hypothetical protein
MLLVSSATMMPTTMYPEGQYQCLRNHIRSSAFRTKTRDGRINGGLSDRSICVLLKVWLPVERVLHGMDGEVPRSGIFLDLFNGGAPEPGVAGSFVVRVVRGRDAPSPRRLGCVGDLDGGVMSWRGTSC